MKNNYKVLIGIPCLSRGGTEQQTLLLVSALVEFGHDVKICCYFEYDEQVVAEFKAEGATVLLLKWSRNIGVLKFICTLSAIIREESPDVVHVQYMAPGLLQIVAAKLARVPFILATIHYPGSPHGLMAHSLIHCGALLTNCFTCVSEAVEKSWFGESYLLDQAFPEKIVTRKHLTIHNAVDMVAIDEALAVKTSQVIEIEKISKGKIIVGTVARLSYEKGIDVLIEAVAFMHKTQPNIHVLIVGEGNQRDYLQSLARGLDISDACTWLGRQSWNEAIGCLGLMDIVIVPSRFEGFGLSAIEAMACGTPVIAYGK